MNGLGVRRGDDLDLIIRSTDADFGYSKHNLVQAILGVGDLFYLSRANISSIFFEEVKEWLDHSHIRATPNIHLVGKSGYDHRIDFIIPRSVNQPERLVRLINNPTKERAQNVSFSWIDVKEDRDPDTRAYAFINDAARDVPDSVIEALAAYEIKPLLWSKRESMRVELAA